MGLRCLRVSCCISMQGLAIHTSRYLGCYCRSDYELCHAVAESWSSWLHRLSQDTMCRGMMTLGVTRDTPALPSLRLTLLTWRLPWLRAFLSCPPSFLGLPMSTQCPTSARSRLHSKVCCLGLQLWKLPLVAGCVGSVEVPEPVCL